MNLKIDITDLLALVRTTIETVVGVLLIVMIFGTACKLSGHPAPWIPAPPEQSLTWLCGAYWLYRK